MENEIKKILLSCGADVCGIANIDRFNHVPLEFSPTGIFERCKAVIVYGVALPKGLSEISPRLVYGHFNSFVSTEVDRIALVASKKIEKVFSIRAVPLPCDTPYEYWEHETMTGMGLISMKHAAYMAGLGDIGKNSLLINPQYGNMLTIGAILVDLDLKSDDFCREICIENCTKCVDSCPVQAIENKSVDQLLCRTNTYGKTARGFETVDCNRCRVVCPKRYGI